MKKMKEGNLSISIYKGDRTYINPNNKPRPIFFQNKLWKKFDNPTEYNDKKSYLTQNINIIKEQIQKNSNYNMFNDVFIVTELENDKNNNLYISKTNRASKIWQDSDFEIIGSKSNNQIILKGKTNSLDKLNKNINDSSFSDAKEESNQKATVISREVFTIQSIKSTSMDKERYTKDIDNYLSKGNNINIIITLYSDEIYNYENIYKVLCHNHPKIKIYLREIPYELLDELSFKGIIEEKNQLNELLNDPNIKYISLEEDLTISRSINRSSSSEIKIGDLKTGEIIGIFDSGINNNILNKFKHTDENYLKGKLENNEHGTFVASKAIFGNQIDNINLLKGSEPLCLIPSAKFIDIKVIDENNNTIDIDKLISAIYEVVKRYKEYVDIYNFSIGTRGPIEWNTISLLTSTIDKICREYDKVFVISAGNHTNYQLLKRNNFKELWKEIYNIENSYISSPGDALNAITVGSVTINSDINSFGKKNGYLSPFSRIGGKGRIDKKPELVMPGGDIAFDSTYMYDDEFLIKSQNKYGTIGLKPNITGSDFLNKDIGTSFSAPLITNACATLLDKIKKSNLNEILKDKKNKHNLIKALLVHNALKIKQFKFENDDMSKNGFGFGKIEDIDSLLNDRHNQFTFIMTDRIKYISKNTKHNYKIQIPDFHGSIVKIIATLVYNPIINSKYVDHYNMTSLSLSLNKNGKSLNKDKGGCYKNNRFNTSTFVGNFKSKGEFDLNINVDLKIHDHLIKNKPLSSEEIYQDYVVIITLIDEKGNLDIRNEIKNTGQFVENNILIESQINI